MKLVWLSVKAWLGFWVLLNSLKNILLFFALSSIWPGQVCASTDVADHHTCNCSIAPTCANMGNPVEVRKAIYHLDESLCVALQEAIENSCFCRQRFFFKNKVKNICNFFCRLDLLLYSAIFLLLLHENSLLDCKCLHCFRSTNLLPYMFKFIFFSLKTFQIWGVNNRDSVDERFMNYCA